MRHYFGTDGVRGRVGEPPITPDFALHLGYAAGKVLVDRQRVEGGGVEHPSVLIGKDTRSSGYMLESALEAGLCAAGVDVRLTGPLTTPGVAYLTRALRLSAGIVISASHNGFEDNGIKFFGANGMKLSDATEQSIEALLEQPMACMDAAAVGRVWRLDDAVGRYIEFCKSCFPNDLDLRGCKLVVDCAHGAAYQVAPCVFHELGARVIAIGNQPDGRNINRAVGATAPQTLRERVLAEQADYGIALDGDGDRLVMVDSAGTLYDGDHLLYVLARFRKAHGPWQAGEGVVGTLMTNLGLEQALAARGIPFARAAVGDRYILERLLETGWRLGGENSGHLLCLDRHSTGDGIVSALQVLAALHLSGISLAQYRAEWIEYPQVLKNVRLEGSAAQGRVTLRETMAHEMIQQQVRLAETALAGQGRVLLRPSGTEPLLRVMVEAADAAQAEHWALHLADAVRNATGGR